MTSLATHIHGNLAGTEAAVAASTSARLKLRDSNRPHSIYMNNLQTTVPIVFLTSSSSSSSSSPAPPSTATVPSSTTNGNGYPPVRSYSPEKAHTSPVHEIVLMDRQRAKSRIRDNSLPNRFPTITTVDSSVYPSSGLLRTGGSSPSPVPSSSNPVRPGTIGADIMNDYTRRLKESEIATHTVGTNSSISTTTTSSTTSNNQSSSTSTSATYRRGSFSSAVAAVGIPVQSSLGLSHSLVSSSSASSRIILKPRNGILPSKDIHDPVSEAIKAAVSASSSATLVTNRVNNHTWNTHSAVHTQVHAPMGGRFDEANLSPTPLPEISRKNLPPTANDNSSSSSSTVLPGTTVVAINIDQQPDNDLLGSSTRTVTPHTGTIPLGTLETVKDSPEKDTTTTTTTTTTIPHTPSITPSGTTTSVPVTSPPIASRYHPVLTPSLSSTHAMDTSSRRSKSVTMLTRRSGTGNEGITAAIQASAAVHAKLHNTHGLHTLSSVGRNLQPTMAAVRQSAELSASIAADIAARSGTPSVTNRFDQRSVSPSSSRRITIINGSGTDNTNEASTTIPTLGSNTVPNNATENSSVRSSTTNETALNTVPTDIATLTSLAAAHAHDFDLQQAIPPRVAPQAPKNNHYRQDKPRVARASSRSSSPSPSPSPSMVGNRGTNETVPSSVAVTSTNTTDISGVPIRKTYAQRGTAPGTSHGGGHPSPPKPDTVRVLVQRTDDRFSPSVRVPPPAVPTTVTATTMDVPFHHVLAPVYNIVSAPAHRPSSPLRASSPPRAHSSRNNDGNVPGSSFFAPIPWNPSSPSSNAATTNARTSSSSTVTYARRSPSPTGHQVRHRSPSPTLASPSHHRIILKRAQSPQASVSAAINAGLSAANAAENAAALATAASITNQIMLPVNTIVAVPLLSHSSTSSSTTNSSDRLSPVPNRVQIARDASAGGRGGVALSTVPTFASTDSSYTTHFGKRSSPPSSPVQAYLQAVTNTNPLIPSNVSMDRHRRNASPVSSFPSVSMLNDDSQVNLTQVKVNGPSKLLVGGSPRTGQAAAAVLLSQPATAPQAPVSASLHHSPSKDRTRATVGTMNIVPNGVSPSRGSRQTDLSESTVMNNSLMVPPITVSTSLADIAAGDIGVWMTDEQHQYQHHQQHQQSRSYGRPTAHSNTAYNPNSYLLDQLNSIADKSTAFRRDIVQALGSKFTTTANSNPHRSVPIVAIHPRTVSPSKTGLTSASMHSPTVVIPHSSARAVVQLDVDRGVTSTVLRSTSPVTARRQPSPEHATVVPHVQATQITKPVSVPFGSAKTLGRIVRRPSVDAQRINGSVTTPYQAPPPTTMTGQLVLVSSPVASMQQPNNRAGAVGKVLGGRKAHGTTDSMNGVIDKVVNTYPFVSSIAELTNASLNALRRF